MKSFLNVHTFFYALGITGLITWLSFSIWILSYDYLALTADLMHWYGQGEKLAQFRATLLTPPRFYFLKILLLLSDLTGLALLFFWNKILKRIETSCSIILKDGKSIYQHILSEINTTTHAQRIFLGATLGFILLLKVYILVYYPILVDEIFTYLYFVSKGSLVSAVYYPGPNNHIFFSLIASWGETFRPILGAEPIWWMRGISVGASMITCIFMWLWLKKELGIYYAFTGILLLNLIPIYTVYSVLARGYSLLTLWVLLNAYSMCKLLENNPNRVWSITWVLSSVAGFYTVPTFLYPWLALGGGGVSLACYQKNLNLVRTMAKLSGITVLGTFLVYLPVFAINGWQAVLRNDWVKPLPYAELFHRLPSYLQERADRFWDDPWGWSIGVHMLLTVWLLYYFIWRQRTGAIRNWSYLLLWHLLAPWPFFLWQGVLPMPRVWTYLSFLWVWEILILLWSIHLKKKYQISLSAVLILGMGVLSWPTYQRLDGEQTIHYQIAKKVYELEIDQAWIGEDTYANYLLYYYQRRQRNLEIQHESITLASSYPLVIVKRASTGQAKKILKDHQVWIENSEISIFLAKKTNHE